MRLATITRWIAQTWSAAPTEFDTLTIGIADELSGAVVGHVAAALHRHQFGTDRGGIDEHVDGEVGAWAVREHVRVLEQQQVILDAVGEQRLLHRERLAVGNPAEPANPQCHVTARRTSRGSRAPA